MIDEEDVRNRPSSELAAVGGIVLGENRDAGTIINEERLAEGMHKLSSSHLISLQQQDELGIGSHSEDTVFDLILTTIRTFFTRILSPQADVVGEESRRLMITDEEIDQLAIFQGSSVEAFANELEGSSETISNEKLSQIKAFLEDEDYIEWERRCIQLMPPAVLYSHFIKRMESYRGKLRAFLGSWSSSSHHCSTNIYLLDDQLTAHRIPVVNQSDAIRGKLGVSKGVHAWDMKISGPVGTHCSIGIALNDSPLMTNTGYVSMIGDNDSSWGWDLVWGNLSHGGKVLGSFPTKHIYDYTSGDIVRLILDCDKGELSYAVNEVGFGIAFQNLPVGSMWYPSAGLVYGNVEVTLIYLGTPPPLRNAKLDS